MKATTVCVKINKCLLCKENCVSSIHKYIRMHINIYLHTYTYLHIICTINSKSYMETYNSPDHFL